MLHSLAAAIALATSPAPPAPPAGVLTGPMAEYAWFPGHWACRTALASAPTKDPTPGKLWVVVDGAKDIIKEYFSTTTGDGKPYRSDDVLRYDATKKAYVRNSVDVNDTQIGLVAPAPFAATMVYSGYLGLQNRNVFRMRATVTYDVAEAQMTSATAFYDPATKTWPVQSTTVCSKIEQ